MAELPVVSEVGYGNRLSIRLDGRKYGFLLPNQPDIEELKSEISRALNQTIDFHYSNKKENN